MNKCFSSDAWSWSLIADCEFMRAPTHSCVILSNSAKPLPTGQVWQRQRVGILPGRNDERRMSWEVLGRLTMKSIVEREERQARSCWQTGRKGKDQWNGCPDKVEELSSLGQIWRLESDWKAKQFLMMSLQIWPQLDWSGSKGFWDKKVIEWESRSLNGLSTQMFGSPIDPLFKISALSSIQTLPQPSEDLHSYAKSCLKSHKRMMI